MSASPSKKGSSFGLCKMACVFKQELILSQIVLVTYMEWLVLRNKMVYTQANAGAKVPPHSYTLNFNRVSNSNV